MRRRAASPILLAFALAAPLLACSPADGGGASAATPSAGVPSAAAATPPAAEPEAPQYPPAPSPDPVALAAAQRVADAGPTSPVAARFRVTAAESGAAPDSWEWFAWRSEDRVVTRETRTDSGEAWFRGSGAKCGGFEHRFHREGWVIEYMPGDLAALGTERTWESVRGLVDTTPFGTALRRTGAVEHLGLACERWVGTGSGGSLVVVWCPALGLPVEIDRRTAALRLRFVLAEVLPLAETPWPEPSVAGLRRAEFSDIGDEPTEPFLRTLAHGMGPAYPGSQAHAACNPGFLGKTGR